MKKDDKAQNEILKIKLAAIKSSQIFRKCKFSFQSISHIRITTHIYVSL